jgi:hemerythrin
MPKITWGKEYNIGVEKIDKQHQKLLQYVNALHSAVELRMEKKELRDLLNELVDFIRLHFSTEEKLMKKHDFPKKLLKEHYKEHKILLDHIEQIAAGVTKDKYPTFYSDYDISSDWAISHIVEHDKKLGDFLNSKGIH